MSRTIKSDFDFGPFEDDYRGYDLRDDDSNRGPLILALALGVLLVFGAVVWNTYRQGVRPADGSLPLITADATPYKSAPVERGGAESPGLNARIYDQMDGSARPTLVKPVAVSRVPEAVPPLPEGDILQGGPPMDLRGSSEDGAADPDTGAPTAIVEQARALENLGGTPADRAGTEVAALNTPSLPMPDPGAVRTARAVANDPAVQKAMFAFDGGGNYLVQISALRSEEAAERAWKEATRKTPDIYRGAEKRIQRADLGAKGVFYRLRVGAFAHRDEATAFCDALKANGQQCMIVAK